MTARRPGLAAARAVLATLTRRQRLIGLAAGPVAWAIGYAILLIGPGR